MSLRTARWVCAFVSCLFVTSLAPDACRRADAQAADEAVSSQIDTAHTGASHTPLTLPLRMKWSTNLPGDPSYAAIADGRVFVTLPYAGTGGINLYALSLDTGKILWGPYPFPQQYNISGPAYEAGQVFVVSTAYINGPNSTICAFDARTGRLNWNVPLQFTSPFMSDPVVRNGVVYAVFDDGFLYAFSAKNGSYLWKADVGGGYPAATPVITDEGIYTANPGPWVFKFNPVTGEQLWRYSVYVNAGILVIPALYNGQLYVGAGDPANYNDFNGLIFNAQTGSLLSGYQKGAFFANMTVPSFYADNGYYVSRGQLVAADAATLTQIRWTAGDEMNPLRSTPIVVNGIVYASRNNLLRGYDAKTGELLLNMNLGNPLLYNLAGVTTGFSAAQKTLIVPTKNCVVALESGVGLADFSLAVNSLIGSRGTSATVTLTGKAPAGGLRLMVSAKGQYIHVPSSVVVPAGKSSLTFTVTTDAVLKRGSGSVIVTSGAHNLGAPLTVVPISVKSAAISPDSVKGGELAVLTFTLDAPAPANGLVVTCISDQPALGSPLTNRVTVPAGKTAGSFVIATGKPLVDYWVMFTTYGNGGGVETYLFVRVK